MRRDAIKGRNSHGFAWLLVTVDDVGDGMAIVHDKLGLRHSVSTTVNRCGGRVPQKGERWIIDKEVAGVWTFASVVEPDPPVITGSRGGNVALGNLLTELAGRGLIEDQTTP